MAIMRCVTLVLHTVSQDVECMGQLQRMASVHGVLQIHGFRLNCWEEHTSQVKELYEKPESTECMRELNAIGDKGWQDYTDDAVHNMTSHLMTYPIKVCTMQHAVLPACHVNVQCSIISLPTALTREGTY